MVSSLASDPQAAGEDGRVMHTVQKLPGTRVRFKSSCTECQRRRKKCNKGKPCSNCIRRYPPVECLYDARPSRCEKRRTNSSAAPWMEALPLSDMSNDLNKLPALSTLNLPNSVRRSSPIVVPKLDDDFINTKSSAQSNKKPKKFHADNQLSVFTRLSPPRSIGSETSDLLREISVDPTASNAELFHLYFAGILPNLWSIDGATPAPPIINEFWIPFMSSSSILVHANLLRAAIWRAGNRAPSTPPTAYDLANPMRAMSPKDSLEILTLKSKSITLLNERLRSASDQSVDDEAIASVIFHFYNEWCWGVRESFGDLNPHAQGLQEMVKIRGGIRNIHSKGGFLAQFVMLVNYHLAVILERDLFICPPSGHDYRFISDYIPTKMGLASPLYRGSQPLTANFESWGVDDSSAQILDDMHFMISYIHGYISDGRGDGDCHSWFLRANRIQRRIYSLPQILTLNKETALETIVYECCRLTAVIYCRAILRYTPFSLACQPEELDKLYLGMGLVPCTRWKQICGTWLWMLCAVNPAARYQYEGLRLRMFLKNCTSALGLIDWQILINAMEGFLSVQRWIRQIGIYQESIA